MTVLILFTGSFGAQEKTADFPVLKGPYLGQKPPGMTPEIFAPINVHSFYRGNGKIVV